MRKLRVGDLVRVSNNLHGCVSEIEQKYATIFWKRGKAVTIRPACRRVSVDNIMPSEDADQQQGIRWRLQFFLDDPGGVQTDANKSVKTNAVRRPWTPYTA